MGQPDVAFLALIIFISAWELYWKGRGLWKAAQHKQLHWFIAMLVLNTIGLLPILYLGLWQRKGRKA